MSNHKKVFYRKGPHFCRDFFWKKCVDFVRLFEIRSHFCQKTVGGNPYIDSKSQLVTNGIFNHVGGFDRVAVIACNRHIFCKTFINAVLTDGCGVLLKQVKKLMTARTVIVMFRRDNGQVGTFSQGIGDGLTGSDTVFGGGHGFGQDNPVAFRHITANNSRNFSKVGVAAFTKQFDGGPA